ncbi:murein transglycosylase A [Rhodocyclus tenuis]|uniref:peptidoglycan lytic exotransglycosylase n=1 Tax=Rhodocyclus tenuis TaxID=1066 RepID=A0A840G4H3_RHOTE|nr:murein transglycosylase A [Rhodocyclus tenuis]MBB4246231.1 membrane-bound lytic murein transglycosylase A [Rhodocyclus tenuis]
MPNFQTKAVRSGLRQSALSLAGSLAHDRRHSSAALLAAVGASLLLAACATPRPSLPAVSEAPQACAPQATCPVCPVCAAGPSAPVAAPQPAVKPLQAARWSDLPGWADDDVSAAWPGFLASCRALAGKGQAAQWPLWRPACEEAQALKKTDAATLRRFFESRFAPYLLTNPDGGSNALITGYYEPLLTGGRTRGKIKIRFPVLAPPDDLITVDLGDVVPEVKNLRLRGRLVGKKIVPYYPRAEIVGREEERGDRVLVWVDDPVELFFLQIQGSGRVRLPDGTLMRVGYADQNGHPYQSIGRLLVERGELKLEQASMQGIQAWARAHPDKLTELLNSNPSYVFFRELPGGGDEGPPGALGVPLTPGRSIAIDPRFTALGAPVFVSTTQPNSGTPMNRLMLAQDTGGAIRGPARADFFWGFGAEAGAKAGRMKQGGRLWVLLPPGLAPK